MAIIGETLNNYPLIGFLRYVVTQSTPEDQKDSVYFEFEEWANSGCVGIPSTEVQRMVDQTIPVWLPMHNDAEYFAKKLCKMQVKELGIRAAAIAARYSVEKCWKNTEDKRPVKAVELVEKWLEDKNSVSFQELDEAAEMLENIAWNGTETASLEWNAVNAASDSVFSITRRQDWSASYVTRAIGYFSVRATSDEELCKVIAEKLPKFCYEDLLRWGYFKTNNKGE